MAGAIYLEWRNNKGSSLPMANYNLGIKSSIAEKRPMKPLFVLKKVRSVVCFRADFHGIECCNNFHLALFRVKQVICLRQLSLWYLRISEYYKGTKYRLDHLMFWIARVGWFLSGILCLILESDAYVDTGLVRATNNGSMKSSMRGILSYLTKETRTFEDGVSNELRVSQLSIPRMQYISR